VIWAWAIIAIAALGVAFVRRRRGRDHE
jgi:hypothetical protein